MLSRQTQKVNAVTFSKTLPPLPVMSALPDEQLIELLLHLQVWLPCHFIVETPLIGVAQKAPQDSARAILNGQPQIAYALITLMVKMGAVDLKVLAVRTQPPTVSHLTFCRRN
jgi:hypothetical protein